MHIFLKLVTFNLGNFTYFTFPRIIIGGYGMFETQMSYSRYYKDQKACNQKSVEISSFIKIEYVCAKKTPNQTSNSLIEW